MARSHGFRRGGEAQGGRGVGDRRACAFQEGVPHLWALVDKSIDEKIPITIEIFGTGNPIPDGRRRYINTYLLREDRLVFHVFEKL